MEYVLLIYGNEAEAAKMSPTEQAEHFKGYMEFTQSISKAGKNKGGNPLQPAASATTVRVRGGKILTSDGPFAETKEQLGGYYLVEAANLDEAIAMAARIPGAKIGAIEVRPVMKINM